MSHGFVPLEEHASLFAPLPLDVAEVAFPKEPAPLLRGWSEISGKGDDLSFSRYPSLDLVQPLASPP